MRSIAYARPITLAPVSAARIILAVAFAMCLPLALVCGTALAGLSMVRQGPVTVPEITTGWVRLPDATRLPVSRANTPAVSSARGPADWRQ